MTVRRPAVVGSLLAACLTAALATAPAASAAVSFANCTAVQKTYPHGVGRAGATDRVSSGRPVTTWKRDTAVYDRAMRANRGLDRDKDGVACEKK